MGASPVLPGRAQHEAGRQDRRRSETAPTASQTRSILTTAFPASGFVFAPAATRSARSWIVQYRRAGATRRMLLGSAEVLTADQARAAAKKTLAAIALGQDPQAEKAARRSADKFTLATMIEDYLAAKKSAVRARTFAEVQRYLRGPYFKPLHGMPVDTITRRDVAARLLVITRENGVVDRRQRPGRRKRVVRVGTGQWAGGGKPYHRYRPAENAAARDRVLSDPELTAIWRAAGDDNFGRIVKLLMLLGQRRTEVGGIAGANSTLSAALGRSPPAVEKSSRAYAAAAAARA